MDRSIYIGLIAVMLSLQFPQIADAYPTVTTSTGPTNPTPEVPEAMQRGAEVN
jgi:hypothetical protein